MLEYIQDVFSAEIITTGPFVTDNGVPGFFTVALSPDEDSNNPFDDFSYYFAHTIGVSGMVEFWGFTRLFSVPDIGAALEDAARSLCTEWSRSPSRSPSSVPRHGPSEWDASRYRDMVRKAAENIQRSLQPAGQNIEKD